MSERKDMSGAIFRNKRKEKETHPDRTGSCVIDGKEYWINGWMKEHDGEPYMSLSFKPKETRQEQPRSNQKPRGSIHDMEDDIPF